LNVTDNFRFLNSYLKRMGPVIDRHQGFIDKYIGDAIMALFADSPGRALRAAADMQREVAEYNRHRARQGYAPIATGIGLNTGPLMLGTVGSRSRLDTTVIGDTVNVAARLQSLTKVFGAAVIASDWTVRSLKHPEEFRLRPIATVRVKGKSAPMDIHEALDADAPDAAERKTQLSNLFADGLAAYKAGRFAEAQSLFERYRSGLPGDPVCDFYFARCARFAADPPREGWDGVSEV
jgi:class 3 adenylate cyclase